MKKYLPEAVVTVPGDSKFYFGQNQFCKMQWWFCLSYTRN